MPLALPLVNGRRFDFSSVLVMMNTIPCVGRSITAINYEDALTPGQVRGGHPMVLGLTRGDYDANASMEMPKEESDLFLNWIIAQGTAAGLMQGSVPPGFMEVRFEIMVAYAESLISSAIQTDELNGCRIVRVSDAHQRGGGAGLSVRFDLFVQHILRNGKAPMGIDALIR